MDDYEEGLHTVALTCSTSGTITLDGSYNTVAYHKIGNWVNVYGRVRVTSTSSPSGGQLRFSLPFQSASPGEDAGRVYGTATIQVADENENHYGIGPTAQGNTFVQIHTDGVERARFDHNGKAFIFGTGGQDNVARLDNGNTLNIHGTR